MEIPLPIFHHVFLVCSLYTFVACRISPTRDQPKPVLKMIWCLSPVMRITTTIIMIMIVGGGGNGGGVGGGHDDDHGHHDHGHDDDDDDDGWLRP